MKKLTFLGLLSLCTINYLLAEEFISDEYFKEVAAQAETLYESVLPISNVMTDEFLPITQTIEEKVREESRKKLLEEELTLPTVVEKEEAPIQALSYEAGLEQAKREGKVIMLTIRSTDCKYCDKMEVGTLSDSSVKDAISANFININYNQDLESLPLNLQEGATPMFIFVNTDEDIINMYPGVRTPKEFKEVLAEILTQ